MGLLRQAGAEVELLEPRPHLPDLRKAGGACRCLPLAFDVDLHC